MQKKDLILGLIKGYDFEVLRPFLSTLHTTNYTGDVVLFHCDIDEESQRKLRAAGATLIPFDLAYPYQQGCELPSGWRGNKRIENLAVYSLRYLLAYWFLKEHSSAYANVMLTDVRDVIFQKDPFDFSISDKLCCFVERVGIPIGGSSINAEWIEKGFGKNTLDALLDKPIVCSGVTIGSTRAVQTYLEIFLNTIVSLDIPADMRGMDQGIHNYLIHTGKLPDTLLYQNDNGPVLTLGLEDEVHIGTKRTLVQKSGNTPNIVHQYDRHWNIAKRYYSPALRYRFEVERLRGHVAKILRPFPTLHRALLAVRDYFFSW